MRINNIYDIDKKDLFYCYSRNLYKYFIKNDIDPIRLGYDKKQHKYFSIFVKTKEVKGLLSKWATSKDKGVRLIE